MFVHNRKIMSYYLHLLHFSSWNPFLKFVKVSEVDKNCPFSSGISR